MEIIFYLLFMIFMFWAIYTVWKNIFILIRQFLLNPRESVKEITNSVSEPGQPSNIVQNTLRIFRL
jgi:hypothetical protein